MLLIISRSSEILRVNLIESERDVIKIAVKVILGFQSTSWLPCKVLAVLIHQTELCGSHGSQIQMMAADALGHYKLAVVAILILQQAPLALTLLTKQYSDFNLVSHVSFLRQHYFFWPL